MPWQKGVQLRQVKREDMTEEPLQQINQLLRQTRVDSAQQTTAEDTQEVQRGARPAPDHTQSSVHGKEVHVAKQKQTQKEVHATINKRFWTILYKHFFKRAIVKFLTACF